MHTGWWDEEGRQQMAMRESREADHRRGEGALAVKGRARKQNFLMDLGIIAVCRSVGAADFSIIF